MNLATIQQKAAEAKKAIAAFTTAAAVLVAVAVPDYADEYAWGTGIVLALLGTFATYKVENQIPADGSVGFDSGPSA